MSQFVETDPLKFASAKSLLLHHVSILGDLSRILAFFLVISLSDLLYFIVYSHYLSWGHCCSSGSTQVSEWGDHTCLTSCNVTLRRQVFSTASQRWLVWIWALKYMRLPHLQQTTEVLRDSVLAIVQNSPSEYIREYADKLAMIAVG